MRPAQGKTQVGFGSQPLSGSFSRCSALMGSGLTKELSFGSVHCVMVGLDAAGKTTLLYRLKFSHYVNTAPTIGFNCEKIKLNGTTMTLWDVGGQDKLRPLWRSYTRCTDAIVFVIDASDLNRVDEAKLELQRICSVSNPRSRRPLPPMLVLANKQDLPSAIDSNRLENLLGLRDLQLHNFHIQSTCAITGEGLREGFERLQQLVHLRRRRSSFGERGGKGARKLARSNSHHFA